MTATTQPKKKTEDLTIYQIIKQHCKEIYLNYNKIFYQIEQNTR